MIYRVLAVGACLIAVTQVLALAAPDRAWVPVLSGVALAAVLYPLRRSLSGSGPGADVEVTDDAAESLQRWRIRTQTLISRAESSRRDWDRHLRPMLARQFELATRTSKRKDATAFADTGRALLGEQLWQWVDPDQVDPGQASRPGPGRAVLAEILRRIEQA